MIKCKLDQYLRRCFVVVLEVPRKGALCHEAVRDMDDTALLGEEVVQKLVELNGSVGELLRLMFHVLYWNGGDSSCLTLYELTQTRKVVDDRVVGSLAVVDPHGDLPRQRRHPPLP